MKTRDQITNEIKTLRDYAPRIRQYSAFGGDNRASIDAQIEALEEDFDENEIDDKEDEGEWTSDEGSAARGAIYWRDDKEEESPSSGWVHLLENPTD